MQTSRASASSEETGKNSLGVRILGEEGEHADTNANNGGYEKDQRGPL
ncbi:hypothetical protein [Streptomyces canus]